MSERGSFVTECIYCDKCFAASIDGVVREIGMALLDLAPMLCHPLRLSVLTDDGTGAFMVVSDGKIAKIETVPGMTAFPQQRHDEAVSHARGYRAGSLCMLRKVKDYLGLMESRLPPAIPESR